MRSFRSGSSLIQFGSTGAMHMARALLTIRKKGVTISRRVETPAGPEIRIQTMATDPVAKIIAKKAQYKNLSALRRWNPGVPDSKLIDPNLSYSGGRGWEHSDVWYKMRLSKHNKRMARAAGLNPLGHLGFMDPPTELSAARNVFDKVVEFRALYQPGERDEPPGDLPRFREGELVDYTVQRHHAKRAGLHRDVRIGNLKHGLLSWATRKKVPSHGETIPIHQQPTHPHSYLGWGGEIKSGYGAGKVDTEELRKALVTKSSEEGLHATLSGQKGIHRVALLKTKSGWLFAKGKVPQPPPEAEKPPAKSLSPKEASGYLKNLEPGTSVQPKIDGALIYVTTKKGRLELFSHRVSKTTGQHPVHTERVFHGRPAAAIPRQHQRTLIGELYGMRRGKAIEPQELGGILNAHLSESIQKQRSRGIKLKIMPFDYVNGKKESYPERLKKVKQTLQYLPGDKFHPPEEAVTPGAAKALYEKIRKGRHPLTREGVVIHPPEGKMVKVKHTKEANVEITGTFPGRGKYRRSHGGFTYEPGGKVGSGLSDETRAELSKYVGRTARIRHQGQFPSGRYRAPVFIAVEENK